MEEGDLLGFDAPAQESAWDDNSASQSDRASTSTYGDVPSFAKPPKFETQESVNLLDLGGSQVDSDQASVNLLEFAVGPVITRVDLMSSELLLAPTQPQQQLKGNPSLPVDVFAAVTTTTTPTATSLPSMNSNMDVFADMVRTAKEMDAKTPKSPTNAHAPTSLGPPPSSNHIVQETTGNEPPQSQTLHLNQHVNGETLLSTMSPQETMTLPKKELPSSAVHETVVSMAASNGSCTENTVQPVGTTVEHKMSGITDNHELDPAPPTLQPPPNSKSDPQVPDSPTTTNSLAASPLIDGGQHNSPSLEQKPMAVVSNDSPTPQEQQHDPPEHSSPTEGNPSSDSIGGKPPVASPMPLFSPKNPVGDTSSASQAPASRSSTHETPISPTVAETPTTEDPAEPTTATNGNQQVNETIVTIPNPSNDTKPQSLQASVETSNSSPQTTNDNMVDEPHRPHEPTKIANTSGPLTPDASQDDSNQIVLLNKIKELEQKLQQAQATISQLQERHDQDEQAATVHGKLLVDLQNNLQTQTSLRADAEEKARRAAMVAKTYKDKLEALQAESKESMEQLGATLGRISAAKSHLEVELESVKQERDDKVRREAAMASKLNVISKMVAEKANSAEYYENQADQLKQELDATKNQLSLTTHERDHLKEELTEWKEYAEKRSKQLEAALAKEKTLNEERKRKMKQFVEAKSEEVRVAKADCAALQSEIDQTNMAVKDMNQRYKQLHAQWVESQTRHRELQRDLTKMKKDSEKMSKVGGTLEAKLSRSAQESEDHKNKRLAAKNELMAVLRQLEAERDVNNRLREKIKMTFTPKVLNQQQSIREILDGFEDTMLKVATKLGRPLPPPPPGKENDVGGELAMDGGGDGPLTTTDSVAGGVSEANMQRVLARLEHETIRVSQSIESIHDSVRRLNSLVAAPSTRGCVDVFSAMLMTSSHTS